MTHMKTAKPFFVISKTHYLIMVCIIYLLMILILLDVMVVIRVET